MGDDGAGGTKGSWTAERLREVMASKGATLRTPAEHRDRWLRSILAPAPTPFTMGLGRSGERGEGFVDSALDTAAGILIELPRLEADAWQGWKDPRFRRVIEVLRRAELPDAPPRIALQPEWSRLRQAVPFDLPVPKPGTPPQTFASLRLAVLDYLVDLEARAARLPEVAIDAREPPAIGASPELPPELLGDRLRSAVERHVARVRRWVLPLADDLDGDCFPIQRTATSLQRRRGEHERLGEGRGLKTRSKLRYHLAAWVLRETGLRRADVGLFLHHVDPSGLQTALPPDDDGAWKGALEKEVDNALACWSSPARRGGDPPAVELGHIEAELLDLLRPARG